MSTQGPPKGATEAEKKKWYQDPGLWEALALGFNSMRMDPDPNLAAMVGQQREQRAQQAERNATTEYLRQIGRDDLAQAWESGALDSRGLWSAISPQPAKPVVVNGQLVDPSSGQVVGDYRTPESPEDERTALIRNYEYFIGQGRSPEEAAQLARGGQTINVNGGPEVGTIPQGYQLAKDPESDAYRMEPIPGGPADREIQQEQAAQQTAQESNTETRAREQDVALENIAAIKETLGRGGMFNLPETGIIGDRLARSGMNQEAVNVRNRLASLQGLIGFDRLQRMRDESPTGGALGAISEKELELLSAQLGTLNQSSDEETLMSTLDRIERIYTGILEKAEAYPNAGQYGFGQQSRPAAPTGGGNRLRFNPETGDFE